MKYNVLGFDQATLISFKLDYVDALVLRFFIDIKDTKKMKAVIIENEPYYWIRYEAIIEEYPIIGLKNSDSVYRRCKKLVSAGVLKHKTVKSGGTYSYYSLGDKYLQLISEPDENPSGSDEKPEEPDLNPNQTDGNPEGVGFKSRTNNPSTIYPSTNILLLYQNIVGYLNKKINSQYRHTTDTTRKAIDARLNEGFKEDDFYKVIDNKVRDWKNTEYEQYLRPQTLFGTKFESYLNQKKVVKKGQGQFNNYDQRSYDYESLERKLLGWEGDEGC